MKREIAINYARRIHAKYSIAIPVNLQMIADKYADLKYTFIPFDIDGISANLKRPGIRPTIIVNIQRPTKRQRFTLAHELGHVLIPWHMGTIFDITDIYLSDSLDYWDMEAEANAFATELLMPSHWVRKLIADDEDIAKINEEIIDYADVSAIAATLRLRSELPAGYLFVVTNKDGTVTYSGKTDGTHAPNANVGDSCDIEKEYPYAENIYEFDTDWEKFIWIKMPGTMPLPSIDYRPWRDVLQEILYDITGDAERRKTLRNQLNGVLGYTNSSVKRGNFCEEALFSACMQRLISKTHLKDLTDHPLFIEFLTSKIKDLTSKANH